MKITVIVRTHNEERNLEKFILSYVKWVDYILIQDDESDSLEYLFDLALKYPRVYLDYYSGDRIVTDSGITRAYQHTQLNQMIEWAESLGTDWIIMDDCDCRPNHNLKREGRKLLEDSVFVDKINAVRLYLYQDKGYIPKLSKDKDEDEWAAGLWAWRANKGFRFLDNGVHGQKFCVVDDKHIRNIYPEYCLLHYAWPDDRTIETKRTRYAAIYGEEYENFNPLHMGKTKKLPNWARE